MVECFYKRKSNKSILKRDKETIEKQFFSCGYINDYFGYNATFDFNLCDQCSPESIKQILLRFLISTLSDMSVDLLDSCIKIQELEGKEKVKQELLNLAQKGYRHREIKKIVKELKLDK